MIHTCWKGCHPDDPNQPCNKGYPFAHADETTFDERGHPRMRARHLKFPIGTKERDAWLVNMNQALDSVSEFSRHREAIDQFFNHFATFMINKPD